MPHPTIIEESERSRRIRSAEGREVARVPVVDRIRPTIAGVVPTIEEENRGVVTIQIWTP